jgi:SOUL heme-binding protein
MLELMKIINFTLRFVAFIVLTVLTTHPAMAIEEPRYEVLEKSGDIELRAYAPMIIAEAVVDGTLDQASNQGFRLIADYIFGGNIAKSGAPGEKIAMTAPVTIESKSEPKPESKPESKSDTKSEPQSQKIEMTAPVTVEPTKEGADNKWRIHFVMPSKYTLATLPTPKNPRVTLREIPAQKSAVMVYSGFNGEEKLKQKTAALQTWMNERKLVATSAPQLARYDPPWTLPFMRRNELMINYR